MTVMICKYCQKEFKAAPSVKRKYCSKSCSSYDQKIWERTPSYYGVKNKGFTGKKHSKETRAKISSACQGKGRPKGIRLILICKHCGGEFKVLPSHKHRQFCSKNCQHENRRTYKVCGVCHETFSSSSLTHCSVKCAGIAKRTRVKKKCLNCGKTYNVILTYKDISKFCGKECRDVYQVGGNNPAYIHGESRRKYPKEFNDTLKKEVKERDSYRCALCGSIHKNTPQKLDVHHIDYDKDNCVKINLISLCKKCHVLTNKKREYWKEYFNQNVITND